MYSIDKASLWLCITGARKRIPALFSSIHFYLHLFFLHIGIKFKNERVETFAVIAWRCSFFSFDPCIYVRMWFVCFCHCPIVNIYFCVRSWQRYINTFTSQFTTVHTYIGKRDNKNQPKKDRFFIFTFGEERARTHTKLITFSKKKRKKCFYCCSVSVGLSSY